MAPPRWAVQLEEEAPGHVHGWVRVRGANAILTQGDIRHESSVNVLQRVILPCSCNLLY